MLKNMDRRVCPVGTGLNLIIRRDAALKSDSGVDSCCTVLGSSTDFSMTRSLMTPQNTNCLFSMYSGGI